MRRRDLFLFASSSLIDHSFNHTLHQQQQDTKLNIVLTLLHTTANSIIMFRINTKSLSFNSDSDDNKATVHSWTGDVAHYAILINTLLFAGTVAFYMNDKTADTSMNKAGIGTDQSANSTNNILVLDAVWKKQGFCVAHADEPYYTSHDVCLYFDTVAAIVLAVLYFTLRNCNGMDNANPLLANGIPGVFGHGIGHGFLAYAARSGTMTADNAALLGWELLRNTMSKQGITAAFLSVVPLTFFWLALIKASLPNKSLATVAVTATVAQFLQLVVPGQLGFTYVQTVLMLAFSLNQLARPVQEKDFSYALYPVLVGFPLTVVGWMESTQCSAFVMDWLYGHVVYDAFIPCSMLVWYLSCYSRAVRTNSSSSMSADKKKKTL